MELIHLRLTALKCNDHPVLSVPWLYQSCWVRGSAVSVEFRRPTGSIGSVVLPVMLPCLCPVESMVHLNCSALMF